MNLSVAYTNWEVKKKKRDHVKRRVKRALQEMSPAEFLGSEYGYYEYETQRPLQWQSWESELINRIVNSDKRVRCIGDVKKNRKTTKAAAIAHYTAENWPGSEIYIIANDLKQAQSRAFEYMKTNVRLNPHLNYVKAYGTKIKYPNGSIVEALPLDPSGEAGGNPTLVVWDEVHGMTRKVAQDMVSEMRIPPNIPYGFHLFTSYAGFEGESELWLALFNQIFDVDDSGEERLVETAKKVQVSVEWENEFYSSNNFPLYESKNILIYWSHGPLEGDPGQPYHTPQYYDEEQDTMLTNQFIRIHKNRWVSGSEDSVLEQIWNVCVKSSYILENGERVLYRIPDDINDMLFCGLDGSTKDDHCAFASVYWHKQQGKWALGPYKIWKPSKKNPLDITDDVKSWLVERAYGRYWVYKIWYDPYQLHQLGTDMRKTGRAMEEFPQTDKHLIPAASDLENSVKNCNILLPDDPTLEVYARNAIAKMKTRGWIFQKQGRSNKIDFVVALSMALKGAIDNSRKVQGRRKHENDIAKRHRQQIVEQMFKEEQQHSEALGFSLSDLEGI